MDDEFEESGNGPAELRKALKEAKKLAKEQAAQIEELKRAQFSGDVRTALQARGLNPGVAKFYPADRPTTDASVDEWVDENRDLFVARTAGNDTVSEIPQEAQNGYALMKQLQAAENYTEMDFVSKLKQYETPEELMEFLHSYKPPMG